MSSSETVSALHGSTFVVSDRRGDVEASPSQPHGLFHMDTRFLSKWLVTIDGGRPDILSVDDLQYFEKRFFLAPSTGTIYENSSVSVIRDRAVGDGFFEEVKILNHRPNALDVKMRVDVGSDFADLFEIKDVIREKKGSYYSRIEGSRLVLGYRRDNFVRETWITPSTPATVDEKGFSFDVHVEPHSEWATDFEVVTAVDGWDEVHEHTRYGRGEHRAKPNGPGLEEWIANAPQLVSSFAPLERIYLRSLVDLAALRFYPKLAPGSALPAAGLPWFMALFGRDSILTSYQALPFGPELARTTLVVLAALQGTKRDDFRDEEPGKIIHEARWGELTAFEERPHSPYFGGSDTTPLFLVLLDEYERWSGDGALVKQLEPAARAALAWIDDSGDMDGDGYVEYKTRNAKSGLDNQCWKDSPDAIKFADGTLAPLPRATCEIQGYVYDAKRRCARLARHFWKDAALADQLEREAEELKLRFNRDFWLPERGFFALALDGQKRKVDSLTSNIGHVLWSGIADRDKAASCAKHIMGDALFSGWGTRTMAEGEGAYNPLGYHVGTVWPHDTSLVAMGLRRYGFADEAGRLAFAVLQTARFFNGRLPEAFAGYSRAMTQYPVEYPTACSPQAWSSGAALLMIRVMMGLEPVGDHLVSEPALPKEIERLELLGVPGRWGRADAFIRAVPREAHAARDWEPHEWNI
jgi:glycogen debranching enzyme